MSCAQAIQAWQCHCDVFGTTNTTQGVLEDACPNPGHDLCCDDVCDGVTGQDPQALCLVQLASHLAFVIATKCMIKQHGGQLLVALAMGVTDL